MQPLYSIKNAYTKVEFLLTFKKGKTGEFSHISTVDLFVLLLLFLPVRVSTEISRLTARSLGIPLLWVTIPDNIHLWQCQGYIYTNERVKERYLEH